MMQNPYFKRIQLIRCEQPHAGYTGIFIKCIWFWGLCLLGCICYAYLPVTFPPVSTIVITFTIAIFCPILGYLFPTSIPITGSCYSIVQGFLLAISADTYMHAYQNILFLAIGTVLIIFFSVLLVYGRWFIHEHQKVKGALISMLLSAVLISIFFDVYTNATDFTSMFSFNYLSLTMMTSLLIFAILHLVNELDTSAAIVKQGIDKRQEWVASYGLFMTILVLFYKVIRIISLLLRKRGEQSD